MIICYNKTSKAHYIIKETNMKTLGKILIGIIATILLICVVLAIGNKITYDSMAEYIDSFSKVEYENQLVPEYDEYGVPYFVTDGDFKVMQLTDVHLCGGLFGIVDDKKAMNAIASMITAEKPDLVVITGDISFAVPWAGTLNNKYAHDMMIRFMENLGVYWTVAFGNHDSEPYNYYNRSDVAGFYEDESLEYCLFDRGPEDVFGQCNHAITVRNSDGLVTKSIIVMDSNDYTEESFLGFDWVYDNIHQDQIEWYRGIVNRYSDYNKSVLSTLPEAEKPANLDDFTTVQSLLFVHIPIMEVRDAYDEYLAAGEKDTENVKHHFGKVGEEAPYVYCSEIQEEMFETMLELGSTGAMFFGHDHINNIVLEYKGIIFSYGYSVDYFAYFGIDKKGSQRGCTMIHCQPDASFEIVHENYYQEKYGSLDEMKTVDMNN